MTKRLEAEFLVIIKRLLNLSHGARDLEREREKYICNLSEVTRFKKIQEQITIIHVGGKEISFKQQFLLWSRLQNQPWNVISMYGFPKAWDGGGVLKFPKNSQMFLSFL